MKISASEKIFLSLKNINKICQKRKEELLPILIKNNIQIQRNLLLFEELIYQKEKEDILYQVLQELKQEAKTNNLNDYNIVMDILNKINILENINELLTNHQDIFNLIIFTTKTPADRFSTIESVNMNEIYGEIINEIQMTKEQIESNLKKLEEKRRIKWVK